MNFFARLLEWLFAPLLLIWLISLGITFLAARDIVERALDDRLNTVAHVLRDEIYRARIKVGNPVASSPDVYRWLHAHPDYPIGYLIGFDSGPVLAGDDTLAAYLSAGKSPVSDLPERIDERMVRGFNAATEGEFVRVLRARIDRVDDRDVYIVLWQARRREDGLLRSIMLREAMPQTLVLLAAAFLIWFGFRYVSRPMRQLKRDLDSRAADDLRPLAPDAVPAELAPLIRSLNALMRRLAAAREAHQRFIADAAHQLRTPLATLRTQLQVAQHVASEAERRAALASLERTIDRVSRVSAQLLSLARAESSSVTATFTEVDLVETCREVTQEYLSHAMTKAIDVEFVHPNRSPRLSGEPTLLGECIRNLIDNAIKYTPRGGSVRVTVAAEPPRIIVEDSGPGIEEGDRERIFAPFARLPRQDSSSGQWVAGSGLGLAIVREVAMLHGARLSVERSDLGGARFEVRFRFEQPEVYGLH
ncbi:MAG: ATP-binding protein [Casimicrobiaceae bacterium]|nr:ATP-binding protein [Casimicrobiaceae bacterium]MCX8097625.1 ATP-binding protein [Casimicrobiaceae bacterium]MDW8312226.1 ATP-binding protein [Burkholderiales bacterium]